MRLWIVAYDIADNRRRRYLARLLGTRMERVQESVFEGWLNGADIRLLLADAAALIESSADAVRAYPLACRDDGRRRTLGCQTGARRPDGHWIV